MNNKLVVVTDLGSFKAYKLEANSLHRTPRLELIEELNLVEAQPGSSEPVGRYRAPTLGKWAAPWGERHNSELEHKRRLIRQVGQALAALLRQNPSDGCYLAASKEITHQIMAELPREARSRIEKILPSDLTKMQKSELLRHFEILRPKINEVVSWQSGEAFRSSGGVRQHS